jgi:hypothetical protein
MVTLGEFWPRNGGPPRPPKVVSEPEPEPEVLCAKTGKIRHRTFTEALKAKTSLYQKNPHCLLNIYKCRYGCNDYHVGRL